MSIKQSDNGAGWEYLGAVAEVAEMAAWVGVADSTTAGNGFTMAEIAAATGKTAQSVRGAMNTAARHFLVVNKPDKTQKGKKAVDRWYLSGPGLADDSLQGEDDKSLENNNTCFSCFCSRLTKSRKNKENRHKSKGL